MCWDLMRAGKDKMGRKKISVLQTFVTLLETPHPAIMALCRQVEAERLRGSCGLGKIRRGCWG